MVGTSPAGSSERLYKEVERDMSLHVEDTGSADTFRVSGRGILHLAILMETMRREGFEFLVGQPRVIYKEINGKKAEPIEILTVDVPQESAGTVIEYVATRRGEMTDMETRDGRTKLAFHVPSRGLIGFRSHMLRATSGEIVLHHRFHQYEYLKGSIPERQTGSWVSMAAGPITIPSMGSRIGAAPSSIRGSTPIRARSWGRTPGTTTWW
jgi:GTP-binding protein